MFYCGSLIKDVSSFNADISNWDVSRVTTMRDTFFRASSFNADISKWHVSRVTDMSRVFAYASSFNADLSKWDVARVTTMKAMFYRAKSFKRTLCGKWASSRATKVQMFDFSDGKLCTSGASYRGPIATKKASTRAGFADTTTASGSSYGSHWQSDTTAPSRDVTTTA